MKILTHSKKVIINESSDNNNMSIINIMKTAGYIEAGEYRSPKPTKGRDYFIILKDKNSRLWAFRGWAFIEKEKTQSFVLTRFVGDMVDTKK